MVRDDESPYEHVARCRTCQIGWWGVLCLVALIVLAAWAALEAS